MVGGQRLALEALRGGLSNWQVNLPPPQHPQGHGNRKGMALEFLRPYSNLPGTGTRPGAPAGHQENANSFNAFNGGRA